MCKGSTSEDFEKKNQKRVKIPQKYIEKRLLQGVNQNPPLFIYMKVYCV